MSSIRYSAEISHFSSFQRICDFGPPRCHAAFGERLGRKLIELLQISRLGRCRFVPDTREAVAGLHLRTGPILPNPAYKLIHDVIGLILAERLRKHSRGKFLQSVGMFVREDRRLSPENGPAE